MLKKTLTLFLFLCSFSLLCQVNLNQVSIKLDSAAWDSVYVRYTSFLGEASSIGGSVYNNGQNCYVQDLSMIFTGAMQANPITRDTTIKVGYFGLPTGFIRMEVVWDTSALIQPPWFNIPLDSFLFDTCWFVGLTENKKTIEFDVFPNPASRKINLSFKDIEEIKSIEMYTVYGTRVFHSTEPKEEIPLINILPGVYLLNVSSETESTSKKIIIQ